MSIIIFGFGRSAPEGLLHWVPLNAHAEAKQQGQSERTPKSARTQAQPVHRPGSFTETLFRSFPPYSIGNVWKRGNILLFRRTYSSLGPGTRRDPDWSSIAQRRQVVGGGSSIQLLKEIQWTEVLGRWPARNRGGSTKTFPKLGALSRFQVANRVERSPCATDDLRVGILVLGKQSERALKQRSMILIRGKSYSP